MMHKHSELSPEKQILLEQRLRGAPYSQHKIPAIPKHAGNDPCRLSFAQEQMWVIDQMSPGNVAYNLPVAYRIRGSLDVRSLEAGLNKIVERHEALRTAFCTKDGEACQIVHPQCPVKIAISELDLLPEDEREGRVRDLASEEATRPFDLSKLPLLRLALYRLNKEDHILIITLHHIVADGLSVGLMLDELDTIYGAFTSGNKPRLRSLPIQYRDYAIWQAQTVAAHVYAAQLEFWRNQLKGRLPVLELPCDKPRPVVQSFKGSNVFFGIPQSLIQELTSLGGREGCTFFMTILAAFQVLLYRYSSAEDIVIGTPIAKRNPRELEPLIGNFLNIIALRCDHSGNPPFTELLQKIKNTTLDAFSNMDVPFAQVVESLKFERDLGRNPIFQVMLQVLSARALKLGNLEISNFHFDLNFAQFDLSLHLYEEAGGYVGRLEYCTELFHRDTVERLSQNLMTLLYGVVRNPQQRISQLPILSETEQRAITLDWNSTACNYPRDKCLHQWFEESAEMYRDRVAAECGGQSLTYVELNARANCLANYLIKSGVKPETFVGVHLERSLDLLVAILGILKAGAAYVPMDPSFPAGRLKHILEDAEVSVMVTQADLRDRVSGSDRATVCLDAEWETIQQEAAQNPTLLLPAPTLAYAIYTSGSTGKSKGVMIEHRSIVNFLNSMRKRPGFCESDVLLAVTTISFDIAGMELFLPLVSGGKVVIARKQEVVDGRLILEAVDRTGVTVLQATPATWKLMIEAGWSRTPGLKMLCGGEQLPRELANRMLERGGELWNMYGPTETTIWSAVKKIEPGKDPIMIGRPIANTQFYIVNREMQPVPVGVPGELLIGGDGLSRGYLRKPDLTLERFAEAQFLGSNTRVYMTGDLARFHSNGEVEVLGRLDTQVKIRGFRIELGEVEHVLAEHDSVQDAVVLARDDERGDKYLVAYLIPAAKKLLAARDLRLFLQKKLPDYMIPSLFVEVERFPLTPNCKIDRMSFPEPGRSPLEASSSHAAPRTELERHLAMIWCEVLGVDRIGIHDNFFELGGHSLLAVRALSRIRQHLGVDMPAWVLFEAPTVADFALRVLEQHAATLQPQEFATLLEECRLTDVRKHDTAAGPASDHRPGALGRSRYAGTDNTSK